MTNEMETGEVNFEVKVLEVYETIVKVKALNRQDAQAKAEELLAVGCYPDNTPLPEAAYSYTLDRDEWNAWEA